MRIVVSGGAGFIGCNVAAYHLRRGDEVTVLDNFSRPGTRANARWLSQQSGRLTLVTADIRRHGVWQACRDAHVVFHFAAQVAVTHSVVNPREDFEVNALGTINLLEYLREANPEAILIYSSTNKVYGEMKEVPLVWGQTRYAYADGVRGISEAQPLDFHSPYGCSKGAADQYVRDYARLYGLRTIVFRQSCIYGERQFGVEDQGWVAWFIIAALLGKPITIYGDGRQVRDVLYVGDLIRAYELAIRSIDRTAGEIYNIGGGPENTLSPLELLALLRRRLGRDVQYSFAEKRPGDQTIFICDVRKALRDFGWKPQVNVDTGMAILTGWIKGHLELIRQMANHH